MMMKGLGAQCQTTRNSQRAASEVLATGYRNIEVAIPSNFTNGEILKQLMCGRDIWRPFGLTAVVTLVAAGVFSECI